jgi:cobalt/nickel transport system permease protein
MKVTSTRPAKGRRAAATIALAAGIAAMPSPAFAMHISEGILPLPWALLWFLASAPFLASGLKSLRERGAAMPELKPLVGLAGAAVFVISCMPIPVPGTGTCSHPCGTGLAALLVGPALTVVIASVSLTLQALFLAHGGLTTLGANIFSLGVAGAYAAIGTYTIARAAGASRFTASFLAGVFSDWATYLMTSLELAGALSGDASFGTMFRAISLAFVPTQLPLGIAEGFVTAGALKFILARKPALAFVTARKERT